MQIIYAIILGTVQGITEFFPVSSSGHLVVLHNLFDFELVSDLAFDVALHLGTLVSLILFFYRDIIDYFRKKDKILGHILVAMLPAGLAGFLLEDFIDSILRSDWIVASMLIIVGVFFILGEKYFKAQRDLNSLSWKKSLVIGLAQILALIPGTSRSGITILAGMGTGLKREQAARFSFLVGLPIFLGAGLKKGWDLSQLSLAPNEWLVFIVGFLTSAGVGYFGVKYLLKILAKNSLRGFAYYRFGLAALLIIYLLFKL